MLDISSLQKALQKLKDGYQRFLLDESDEQIRDGLIQRFEFTYELSHKTLKRYLEMSAASPEEFDEASFQYIIRSANEKGLLLGDWPKWSEYRKMRGTTSHTYDEKKALQVVAIIPDFIEEADHLTAQLAERLQREQH